jgi:hypothetical protein
VVVPARPLEGFLQRLGREGIRVRVLQAKIAQIAGRSELDADEVSGMLAGAGGNYALLIDIDGSRPRRERRVRRMPP